MGAEPKKLAALGQVMAVRPVRAQRQVVAAQQLANSRRDALLADAQMHRAAHLLLGIQSGNALFDQPNAEHRPVKLARQVSLHVGARCISVIALISGHSVILTRTRSASEAGSLSRLACDSG